MPWQSTINEFFVRLHDDGNGIRGMHVAERTAFFENGAEVAGTAKLLPPRPVTLEDTQALSEIGAAVNLATAATVSQQDVAITSLEGERDAALQGKQQAEAARDMALADAQALREKYEPGLDANGVPLWVYASQAHVFLIRQGQMNALTQRLDQYAATGIAGEEARAWFHKSARFYRNNTTLNELIAAGWFTAETVDNWFKGANEIPVA